MVVLGEEGATKRSVAPAGGWSGSEPARAGGSIGRSGGRSVVGTASEESPRAAGKHTNSEVKVRVAS